jgi:hypothetical protein
MKGTFPAFLSISVLTLALSTPTARAQVDPVQIFDPMPGISAILGAANMDNDPADEIALVYDDERIMIVDSSSGQVDFDSDSYRWSRVMPPAWNLSNSSSSMAGHNYGFDVFCDEDGDGVYCLMILISEVSPYEQQLAVICLQGSPTAAPDVTPSGGAKLGQNVPNPFNPTTRIDFTLAGSSRVGLRIYDTKGRHVRTLVDGELPAGDHSVVWDGTDDAGRHVGSGAYLYQLESGGVVSARKSLLLK